MNDDNTKSARLDIFRVINAANKKNVDFFDELTPEEQKTFYPVLIMRWMSGTIRPDQVVLINELINPLVFSMSQHKLLLWQLLTIANSGTNQKVQWIKAPGRGNAAKPMSIKLLQDQYGYSIKQASESLSLLTMQDVYEMAVDRGFQPTELTKLKKEWV